MSPKTISFLNLGTNDGTRKIASQFVSYLTQHLSKKAVYIDLDYENSNSAGFEKYVLLSSKQIKRFRPSIVRANCVYCAKCISHCKSNAIIAIKELSYIHVSKHLCLGCGACYKVCRHKAVKPLQSVFLHLKHYKVTPNLEIVEGKAEDYTSINNQLLNNALRINNNADFTIFNLNDMGISIEKINASVLGLLVIVCHNSSLLSKALDGLFSVDTDNKVMYGVLYTNSADKITPQKYEHFENTPLFALHLQDVVQSVSTQEDDVFFSSQHLEFGQIFDVILQKTFIGASNKSSFNS